VNNYFFVHTKFMQKPRIQDKSFFEVSAETLAVNLLGKHLVRNIDGQIYRYLITETECYMGIFDSACHACRGKTPRASTLWEKGGTLYVHMIYGIHYMLNIVAGEEGDPMGVLIRGVKGIIGPGNLTRMLEIRKDFNREDLLLSERIWIEETDLIVNYEATPRIGINYAKIKDREKLWRFVAYNYL
jgi:DNA-3-methyladenine glycosylase